MVLHALDSVGVAAAKWLVHVVGVGGVLGSLDLVGVSITLGQHVLTSDLILLHHLDAEDVVDLDVMSGEAVVQEVWWEHHVVALEPEFRVVLSVEEVDVSRSHESESG